MIDRLSIVSRLTQVLYPGKVPEDRVKFLPHQLALLDVVAESVATGKAPSVPLALMAGDPCPYEPVGGSELDQPVPFVPCDMPPAAAVQAPARAKTQNAPTPEDVEAFVRAGKATRITSRYVEPDSIPANPRGGRS